MLVPCREVQGTAWGPFCGFRLVSTTLMCQRWEAVNHQPHPWSRSSYLWLPFLHTLTHLNSYFCSSAVPCVFARWNNTNENPTTEYTFFFKQVQTWIQPQSHPNSPKPWGSPCLGWAFGVLELSRGETLYTSLGDHSMYTGALKVADEVAPTTTSSWLHQ